MNHVKLDQALSAFVDSPECQKINDALLETVRTAYKAGWDAATEQITELEALVKSNSREIAKLKLLHELL